MLHVPIVGLPLTGGETICAPDAPVVLEAIVARFTLEPLRYEPVASPRARAAMM